MSFANATSAKYDSAYLLIAYLKIEQFVAGFISRTRRKACFLQHRALTAQSTRCKTVLCTAPLCCDVEGKVK